MSDKARGSIMVLAGGYLVYIGFQLVQSALQERPDFWIGFLIFGIFCMVIGAVTAVRRAKGIMDESAMNRKELDLSTDIEDGECKTIEEGTEDRRSEELVEDKRSEEVAEDKRIEDK